MADNKFEYPLVELVSRQFSETVGEQTSDRMRDKNDVSGPVETNYEVTLPIAFFFFSFVFPWSMWGSSDKIRAFDIPPHLNYLSPAFLLVSASPESFQQKKGAVSPDPSMTAYTYGIGLYQS